MDGCSYKNNTLQDKFATTQDEHWYFPQYIINSAGDKKISGYKYCLPDIIQYNTINAYMTCEANMLPKLHYKVFLMNTSLYKIVFTKSFLNHFFLDNPSEFLWGLFEVSL